MVHSATETSWPADGVYVVQDMSLRRLGRPQALEEPSPTNVLGSGSVCIESLGRRAAGIPPLWGERLPGDMTPLHQEVKGIQQPGEQRPGLV